MEVLHQTKTTKGEVVRFCRLLTYDHYQLSEKSKDKSENSLKIADCFRLRENRWFSCVSGFIRCEISIRI